MKMSQNGCCKLCDSLHHLNQVDWAMLSTSFVNFCRLEIDEENAHQIDFLVGDRKHIVLPFYQWKWRFNSAQYISEQQHDLIYQYKADNQYRGILISQNDKTASRELISDWHTSASYVVILLRKLIDSHKKENAIFTLLYFHISYSKWTSHHHLR